MKNTLSVQKHIAKRILEKLEILDPYCILAGGAPRDWYFNRVASDLDFYLHTLHNQEHHVIKALKGLGFTASRVQRVLNLKGEYEDSLSIKYVFEAKFEGETIQFIFMKEPTFRGVVGHFCNSLCKIWWKGRDVMPTPEFTHSVRSNTMRIMSTHLTSRHTTKMLDKFPDFSVQIEHTDTIQDGSYLDTVPEWNAIVTGRWNG